MGLRGGELVFDEINVFPSSFYGVGMHVDMNENKMYIEKK